MIAQAQIISVTFTSPKCFYCENSWEYRLQVEPVDENGELTGELVEVRVCEKCRTEKTLRYADRIRMVEGRG